MSWLEGPKYLQPKTKVKVKPRPKDPSEIWFELWLGKPAKPWWKDFKRGR